VPYCPAAKTINNFNIYQIFRFVNIFANNAHYDYIKTKINFFMNIIISNKKIYIKKNYKKNQIKKTKEILEKQNQHPPFTFF
jgi:hypothetical protein